MKQLALFIMDLFKWKFSVIPKVEPCFDKLWSLEKLSHRVRTLVSFPSLVSWVRLNPRAETMDYSMEYTSSMEYSLFVPSKKYFNQ